MKGTVEEKISNIISILFHPLLMPTIGILIIINSGTHFSLLPIEVKRIIFYSTLIITCVLPLTFIPILKLQGAINTYRLSDYKERFFPLLITTILYFIGYYFFSRFHFIPRFIKLYSIAVAIAVLLAFIITLKWKISLHMLGIGGLTGLILALIKFDAFNLQLYVILVFVISGIIAYARLRLNEHYPFQVYWGYCIGFLSIYVSIIEPS